MPEPLVLFTLNRIIVHEIFQRTEDKKIASPRLSEELLNLPLDGKRALQDRIVRAMGSDSHCLDMSIEKIEPNSCFDSFSKIIEPDSNQFIKLSREIALKLAEAQTSRNIPGGVVVVFDGVYGSPEKHLAGIIKAEEGDGFGKLDQGGKIVIDYMSNILLTQDKKLYKIGLFQQQGLPTSTEGISPDHFSASVYDHNMLQSESSSAAFYFYSSFLGCSIKQTDKTLTKAFYDQTSAFIENSTLTQDKKLDMHTLLYTYLKNENSSAISTNDFAENYLPSNLRSGYRTHMSDCDFPTSMISKNLALLLSALKKRTIIFSSKVRLSAPSEGFDEAVEIIDQNSRSTTIRIRGEIKKQS